MHRFSAFWLKSIIMPPLRSRAGAYSGGHLAAQLVKPASITSAATVTAVQFKDKEHKKSDDITVGSAAREFILASHHGMPCKFLFLNFYFREILWHTGLSTVMPKSCFYVFFSCRQVQDNILEFYIWGEFSPQLRIPPQELEARSVTM